MYLRVLLESPRGVSPRLEWGHARSLSSGAVAAVSCFPSRGSRDQGLSLEAFHEAFPRGFPTGQSHVTPWCESILGLKVEAMQGKQVSLEWTETSGRLWEFGTTLEILSPFRRRGPPLEMRRERREFFPDHAGKVFLLSSYEAVTGLLWMWAGRSCFLSCGDGYDRELLELQEGCEGHFVSSRG